MKLYVKQRWRKVYRNINRHETLDNRNSSSQLYDVEKNETKHADKNTKNADKEEHDLQKNKQIQVRNTVSWRNWFTKFIKEVHIRGGHRNQTNTKLSSRQDKACSMWILFRLQTARRCHWLGPADFSTCNEISSDFNARSDTKPSHCRFPTTVLRQIRRVWKWKYILNPHVCSSGQLSLTL